MLLARWMLPVPHDVANLTNLFSPALDCAGIPGINGRQQTHTNTTHEKSRKPNNSTTEQVSIPMVSLSTSCMMKWKLRRWESILYEISVPRAVLNSVALLILLPRGRNGCACTQGCNPHGRFAGVMTFSDLHCRFVGVKKLVVPSVSEIIRVWPLYLLEDYLPVMGYHGLVESS